MRLTRCLQFFQEEMEAAIENTTQQTAQDLHMLLGQARAPSPCGDPHATPLGKENVAAPAGAGSGKINRAAAGVTHLNISALQGRAAEPDFACNCLNACVYADLVHACAHADLSMHMETC